MDISDAERLAEFYSCILEIGGLLSEMDHSMSLDTYSAICSSVSDTLIIASSFLDQAN